MDEIYEILTRRLQNSAIMYQLFMDAPSDSITKIAIWAAYLELIDIVDPIILDQARQIKVLKIYER